MVVPNTLVDIRAKVRKLTARLSPDQISNAEIDQYVNTYYLYDMPESLRLLKLKDIFTFTTNPNQEAYPIAAQQSLLNDSYMTFEPPAYVGGQLIQYFQDVTEFYNQWPKNNYIQQFSTGNGTNGPYTATLTGTPFMRSINPLVKPGRDIRTLFSANITTSTTTSALDDGNGGLFDPATGLPLVGNINYITGAINITFAAVVPAGVAINATTIPYTASWPRAMLFYQNQFIMRPIPDKAYIVEINAFRYPTALLANNDQPELAFWWQLLAYGAARKILVDNGDYENVQAQEPYFLEQLAYVQRRTLKLLSTQRAQTIYGGQGSAPFSNLYPYI